MQVCHMQGAPCEETYYHVIHELCHCHVQDIVCKLLLCAAFRGYMLACQKLEIPKTELGPNIQVPEEK